jgi:cytochrome c peroxidase
MMTGPGLPAPIDKENTMKETMNTMMTTRAALVVAAWVTVATLFGAAPAHSQMQEPQPNIPGSLKTVPVPEASDISTYIKDKPSAIALGKALFWDMQVGSDNQACASCHFHAGADNRTQGAIDPGLRSVVPAGDTTYQLGGPNYTVTPSDYPFHKLSDPQTRYSDVLFDTNDVTGSQGTYFTQFVKIVLGQARDKGTSLDDPPFSVYGVKVRRVEPRNTPTVINAVFNAHNFWDGRASYYFNGNNPFGPLDENSGIFVTAADGTIQKQIIRIEKSSLASQATGPALSEMEMSFLGRTWPDLGKKMLSCQPLSMQIVHPSDSVLGLLSSAKQKVNGKWKGQGLTTDYVTMIQNAFWDQYWSSSQIVTFVNGQPVFSGAPTPGKKPKQNVLPLDQYTQMEANMAFFFGLAIQEYESTLVSNDSPFDRFSENPAASPLTTEQRLGLGVYLSKGRCANCHTGAEFTNASVSFRQDVLNRIELMPMNASGNVNGGSSFYDGGFYNTGARNTNDDIGRGGDSPFINPLTGQPFPLSHAKLGLLARQNLLPADVAAYVAPLPQGAPYPDPGRTSVNGAFKVSSLRNVELTGPYFHNGGQATLRQVVDLYSRGADFHDENVTDLHPDIADLFLTEQEKSNLVAFLLTLTDDRVRNESAPFDHPQLFLPNGSSVTKNGKIPKFNQIGRDGFRDAEIVSEIPPVGVGGLPAEALPPIGTFLGLDPYQANTVTAVPTTNSGTTP